MTDGEPVSSSRRDFLKLGVLASTVAASAITTSEISRKKDDAPPLE